MSKTPQAVDDTQPDDAKPPSTPYGKLYLQGLILCGVLMGACILMLWVAPDLMPGHVQMLALFVPCGAMLMISGIALLDINSRKTSNFTSSAPYAGKVDGLSRGQALFFNWVLVLMGFATIVAGIAIYLHGPVN